MITVRAIQLEVCAKYGVALREMLSPCKSHRIAHPRHEAIARARSEIGLSWHAIGRLFGRDHTTCIYAERAHIARERYWQEHAS